MTNMAHQSNLRGTHSFLLAMLLLLTTGVVTASAQSSDQDAPEQMTSNILEGEGDGKSAVYYYKFTAGPGDVKITVDGKTDGYSSPLKVDLMDEDSKTLQSIYVVAVKEGKREVKKIRLVRQQEVVMKISMRDDPDIKLLAYKIKLEGQVTFPESEQPATESTPQAESNLESSEPSSAQTESQTSTESEAATTASSEEQSGAEPAPQPSVKQKAKAKAKNAAKKTANKLLDKFPF